MEKLDLEEIVEVWENIKKVIVEVVRGFAKVIKKIVKIFKSEWAKYLVTNGNKEQMKRAMIYLRTKNKRIKRKQWRLINPF